MMKKIIALLAFAGFVAAAGFVFADSRIGQAARNDGHAKKFLNLPKEADDNDVVYLGTAKDPASGKQVEGYAIIRRAGSNAKSAKPARTVPCYGFLANGAKWKNIEPWVLDPANSRGLSADFLRTNLAYDISKWEDAADGKVDGGITYNILGDGSFAPGTFSAGTLNDKNEVYFANVSTKNAIAVTIVWGYFRGLVSQRELVEWDQVYDDVDFDWSSSSSGEAGKMDFENIATHELGHSVGMNDLYNSSCNQETMYGYASYGETIKRTLNSGDILGISTLY